jgi:hypothetical protein
MNDQQLVLELCPKTLDDAVAFATAGDGRQTCGFVDGDDLGIVMQNRDSIGARHQFPNNPGFSHFLIASLTLG